MVVKTSYRFVDQLPTEASLLICKLGDCSRNMGSLYYTSSYKRLSQKFRTFETSPAQS